ALRLTSSLEHLLGHPNTGQNDLLLISTLDLLHGVLLIHPPSRTLFSREIAMNLLLDMLDPSLCPAIQSSTLLTLVTALLACPKNTRTFEKLDGLLTVTSLFKSRAASREVKMKSVEFLYFYLMPETSSSGTTGGGSREKEDSGSSTKSEMTGSRMGAGRKLGGVKIDTRSTEEKQALLGKYLNNVEDLVEDLRESAPFGAGYA
ncbi:hypothetical protein MMC25_000477, partial [Agyrium rufum]|nr:hypothetical protein [Agyrium rufum]